MGPFGLRNSLTSRFLSQLLPKKHVAFSDPINTGLLADSALRSSDLETVHLVLVCPTMLCPRASSTDFQQQANEDIWLGLEVLFGG